MHSATKYAFRDECLIVETGDDVIISGPCAVTGKPVTVSVKAAAWRRFQAGGFVQDCFPDLSASDREFLISGLSSEAWDQLFPHDEEEENASND